MAAVIFKTAAHDDERGKRVVKAHLTHAVTQDDLRALLGQHGLPVSDLRALDVCETALFNELGHLLEPLRMTGHNQNQSVFQDACCLSFLQRLQEFLFFAFSGAGKADDVAFGKLQNFTPGPQLNRVRREIEFQIAQDLYIVSACCFKTLRVFFVLCQRYRQTPECVLNE